MGVKAYDVINDVARKLNKEEDDIILMAVIEYSETVSEMIPPTHYAASIYDRYVNRGEIPEWLQAWAVDVMIGRFVFKDNPPNVFSFKKGV